MTHIDTHVKTHVNTHILKFREFRGLLPGEEGRQITLWILKRGSSPLRECFEVL
jgi:hypothetical protein